MTSSAISTNTFKRALTYALIVHVIFLLIITVSISFNTQVNPSMDLSLQQADKIVQATSVNQTEVNKEIARLQETQAQKQKQEEAKVAALKQQALAAENAKKAQQAALEKIKQQQLLAQQQAQDQLKQLATIKQQAAQAKAEQQALQQKNASLKQQQVQAQKKQLQQDALHSLQSELASEQTQLNKQKQVAIQNELQRYSALILQAIQSNWQYPPNINPNLSCVLEIKLTPAGDVTSVSLLKSSGNQMLDQSAIAAVYKSAPLPVSSDPDVFAQLQDISLTAKPQG